MKERRSFSCVVGVSPVACGVRAARFQLRRVLGVSRVVRSHRVVRSLASSRRLSSRVVRRRVVRSLESSRRLSVDLVRLLSRASGAAVQERERDTLDAALAARTSLPPEARTALLDLALSPRFRTVVSPAELLAFGGRFGAEAQERLAEEQAEDCLLYTSPSPRDRTRSRMPSSA